MTVANATPAQKVQLDAYVVMLRVVAAQFMKTMNQMNALNNSWNGTISAIIGTPAGTTIADSSSFAGIAPLTDTDVTNITSYFQGVMTSYYDAPHQQVMTKACGPGNTIS
jgi:hypothetical protein